MKDLRISMKFRPLHDRVALRRLEEDAKSAGGIIIPDTVKEKPMRGEIVAVGPGPRDESGKITALDVKAGDIVLFGKWSGTEVKIDGEDLLIMKESDILGVIEGTAKMKPSPDTEIDSPRFPNKSGAAPHVVQGS
jgi:chaperonin GroES